MTDGPIMINDELDALSNEQHLTILIRTLRALGYPVEYNDNGGLCIHEDMFDPDNHEFREAWEEEAKRYVARIMCERMAADGDIAPSRVDEDGNIIYAVA